MTEDQNSFPDFQPGSVHPQGIPRKEPREHMGDLDEPQDPPTPADPRDAVAGADPENPQDPR